MLNLDPCVSSVVAAHGQTLSGHTACDACGDRGACTYGQACVQDKVQRVDQLTSADVHVMHCRDQREKYMITYEEANSDTPPFTDLFQGEVSQPVPASTAYSPYSDVHDLMHRLQ